MVQQITMSPDMEAPSLECKIVLNKKAAVGQTMVEVMHRIVEDYFGKGVQYEHFDDPIGTSMFMPDVPIEAKGIRMYPPTMESNDSPSYPGLKSTYYLHRFDVRVSGIPQEAFRTVKG